MLEIGSTNHFIIMKKFISTLAAFFLGLFVSISIIACADNDDDSSLAQLSWSEFRELRNARILTAKYLTEDESYECSHEYSYDDKGRISNIYYHVKYPEFSKNYQYQVTYSGNTILITCNNESYTITVSEGAMSVPFVVNEFVRNVIAQF